jgi:hypothetical protein
VDTTLPLPTSSSESSSCSSSSSSSGGRGSSSSSSSSSRNSPLQEVLYRNHQAALSCPTQPMQPLEACAAIQAHTSLAAAAAVPRAAAAGACSLLSAAALTAAPGRAIWASHMFPCQPHPTLPCLCCHAPLGHLLALCFLATCWCANQQSLLLLLLLRFACWGFPCLLCPPPPPSSYRCGGVCGGVALHPEPLRGGAGEPVAHKGLHRR